MSRQYRHVYTLHAYSGDSEPLAKYIEDGGKLMPCMREFIAGHLRGEFNLGRGRRRAFAKKQRDREVGEEVQLYQDVLELNRSKAIERYLDTHPEMNPDTLKSILRRYEQDLKAARQRIESMLQKQRHPSL